jgi:hypothetical protein
MSKNLLTSVSTSKSLTWQSTVSATRMMALNLFITHILSDVFRETAEILTSGLMWVILDDELGVVQLNAPELVIDLTATAAAALHCQLVNA